MLKTELQYFLDNQDELVKKYGGKYIVIKGNKVIGNYDHGLDALYLTQEQGHKLGTFLIKWCLPSEECYTTIDHNLPDCQVAIRYFLNNCVKSEKIKTNNHE